MANKFHPYQLNERNPITYQAHKRQITWQIFVPFGVGLLLVLAIAVCATQGSNFQVSQWADASLVMMIFSWMLLGFLSLVGLIFSIFAISRVLRFLPFYFFRFQGFLFRLQIRSHAISNRAVEPFLRMHSFTAKANALKRQFSFSRWK